jgi:hypothetical protein
MAFLDDAAGDAHHFHQQPQQCNQACSTVHVSGLSPGSSLLGRMLFQNHKPSAPAVENYPMTHPFAQFHTYHDVSFLAALKKVRRHKIQDTDAGNRHIEDDDGH